MSERCNLKTLTAALCCFYHKNSVITAKFSRDQFILDCPSEKLRKELEEELKMDCEELRSHAWYHGAIPRQVAENLVQRDGDFLIRDSLSSPGSYVLTSQWRNAAQHFKINKKVVMLNEAYSRVEYRLEREGFDNVPALIRFYVGNRKPVSQVVGAIIFQPINRGLPLRCLEEKYGLSNNHRDRLMTQERRSQKRLSLNISNGHAHDNTHAAHDSAHCRDNGVSRGGQLRMKDRCGSQPASLNQVQERRRPLKAHQSESYLPLGSKSQSHQAPDPLLSNPNPKSPVFRTGSEPALSPSVPRRSAELLAGQAIRGSDSQLCPKPPPKPSKVPLARLPRSPGLQPLALPPSSSSGLTDSSAASSRLTAPPLDSTCMDSTRRSGASTGPPVPPVKPLKFPHPFPPADSLSSSGSVVSPPDPDSEAVTGWTERLQPSPAGLRSCSALEWEESNSLNASTYDTVGAPLCSYVERLRKEGEGSREEEGDEEKEAGGRRGLDRSSYHHAIAALENTSEEEEEEEEEKKRRARERSSFQRPVVETESTFRPAEFGSRLLPPENKPLEMVVLKRAKELLLSHNHHSIARHLLLADCQVVCVPLLLPLLTLMERPSITPEGAELWETSDQGCDIMLRHLEAARDVAHNAQSYTANAQRILQEFECDDELLEVFKTDFQLRLLWGSRGASVNQSDRYNKFNLILTALSRKLEPPPKTQTLI
ncbi:Breast cancer anti-estrogen resistance protein 3 -like protein [Collichthys lucidus]|uniref:Breast cancer anti-estrogen resistance protein 3-like protein n=1 Tax=Collichthys lucidus TaxID=240159 RepID=A0A4U5UJZ5_COLLU|nr:Breast cancer anti-estrogen resistance protein 3 -like protein [Collichthys lucidus]